MNEVMVVQKTESANAIIPASPAQRFEMFDKYAEVFAKSQLFGVKTKEQALALMLVADSEGRHPATVARDYHIIQGRPTLKADVVLARFQEAGGSVEWHEYTDTKVSGTFKHPQGGSIKITWDMAKAQKAGLTGKDVWKGYPAAMLRSRCISEGIRTVYPGVFCGFHETTEAADIPAPAQLAEPAAQPTPTSAQIAEPAADPSPVKRGRPAKTAPTKTTAEVVPNPDPEPEPEAAGPAPTTPAPAAAPVATASPKRLLF